MSRPEHLFSSGDLGGSLRAQEQKMEQAAQVIPADHALASSAPDLAAELLGQFRVEPLVLDEEAITVSHQDAQVDVSRDQMRMITDRSRPFHIPGTTVTYHVPYSGEADLFKMRPSTWSMSLPMAVVGDGELRISATVPTPVPASLKGHLDGELAKIRQFLGWVNADVDTFNDRLEGLALTSATRRREKVIADHDLIASFGVPVRRAAAPKTYAAPPVRRSVPRAPTSKGSATGPLEPVLPAETYEHILGVARQMVAVMERSPKSFVKMNEEAIRDHFLVQLNGQYEGDATGETFNFEGKTDILIRRNGRNLFVAECKFWGGPKKLIETVDQLLGYASWRDTKTAIFVFNRGRELSKVLAQVSPTITAHPNFVREATYGGETDFRFTIAHRDDPERELTLTILVFEVPA